MQSKPSTKVSRGGGAWPLAGEWRTCPTCGGTFHVWPSQIKQRRAEFCSQKCKGPATAEAHRGMKRSAETRAKIAAKAKGRPGSKTGTGKPWSWFVCEQCGEPFSVPPKRVTQKELIRFCVIACWYDFLRLHPEQNHLFRGGYEPYYGPNWNEQARLARVRDGHTCQDCGVTQRHPLLDVHHLVARRTFNGDHVAANAIDNLVTLCKSCHTARENAITPLFRA